MTVEGMQERITVVKEKYVSFLMMITAGAVAMTIHAAGAMGREVACAAGTGPTIGNEALELRFAGEDESFAITGIVNRTAGNVSFGNAGAKIFMRRIHAPAEPDRCCRNLRAAECRGLRWW